jgi:hypothetical protein
LDLGKGQGGISRIREGGKEVQDDRNGRRRKETIGRIQCQLASWGWEEER